MSDHEEDVNDAENGENSEAVQTEERRQAYVARLLTATNPRLQMFTGAEDVDDFLEECDNHVRGMPEEAKIGVLLGHLKGKLPTDWKHVNVQGIQPPLTYDQIKNLMRRDFQSSSNDPIALRQKLKFMVQMPTEPVLFYMTSKHRLCLKIDPNMSEIDIMANLQDGILPEIRKQIYTENPDNLEDYKQYARQIERGLQSVGVSPSLSQLSQTAQQNSFQTRELVDLELRHQKEMKELKQMMKELRAAKPQYNSWQRPPDNPRQFGNNPKFWSPPERSFLSGRRNESLDRNVYPRNARFDYREPENYGDPYDGRRDNGDGLRNRYTAQEDKILQVAVLYQTPMIAVELSLRSEPLKHPRKEDIRLVKRPLVIKYPYHQHVRLLIWSRVGCVAEATILHSALRTDRLFTITPYSS